MRPFWIVLAAVAALAAVTASSTPAAAAPAATADLSWQLTPTGSTAQFRGLAAVSPRVAWVSGSAGTVLRTTDGGAHWASVGPPDTADLEFRDVEAASATTAVILSIGPGGDSRIYRTTDGGAHWALAFRNDTEAAFYDCMTFTDPRHGLALSDPVDGKFRIAATADGGRSWRVRPDAGMPPASDGEFAFAASGQCLVSAGGTAWFATGGGAAARVFRSTDDGRTWTVAATPVPSGPTAGIYALAFADRRHGIAVGGDYRTPASAPGAAAVTGTGGTTWRPAAAEPGEYRSGVTFAVGPVAIAVGPTGSDVSLDGGNRWARFDTGSFDSVECAGPLACWASGVDGRVARLALR